MLSVTTATVHRTMCPSTPKNSAPERKGRSWSCDYSAIPKRRCRPSASKKNLSIRLTDAVEFNVEVPHQPTVVDDSKAVISKKSSINGKCQMKGSHKNNLESPKNESSSMVRRCPNQLYREASINAKTENCGKKSESSAESHKEPGNCTTVADKVEEQNQPEICDADRKNSIISSSPIAEVGEKRKRGFESRISVALKMLKSDDNDINYSKCRPNMESSMIEPPMNITKDDPVDEVIENIFPEATQFPVQENWGSQENWDSQVNNWDNQPQENWDNWDNLNATADNVGDPLSNNSSTDIPYYMTGFPNPPGENRCWLNATLQTLFALPFVDQLGRLDLKKCSSLTRTLVAMQVFWKEGESEKEKTYQIVTRFKDQLEVLDESYSSQRQQDVSEFLMIFLNHVKSDCEESLKLMDMKKECENVPDNLQNIKNIQRSPQTPNKRPPLTQISPFKRRINFNDSSERQLEESSPKSVKSYDESPGNSKFDGAMRNPIDEFFSLPMMEHYVCQNCMKHRQRKVDNLMLYVDLPENETDSIELADAINKTFLPEDRNLTCSKCKCNEHKVYTTFRGTPNVLIVQINRYGKTSDGYVAKMNSTVHIPEALHIPTTESLPEGERGQKFVPVCTISHVGGAMDCGHYTSYVKHGDQWFHYNDMSVTPMTSTEALTAAETTAYLVFFVNVNLLTKSPSFTEEINEEISR